jgi:DNA invertase Pin-like site-specific DNA recombinase
MKIKPRGSHNPLTEAERKQILELYNNGKGSSFREIGERVNRNRYTVYKVCKDWQPPKERIMEDTTGIFQYTEKHFESLFINFSA